jgi:hypothetical protein
MWKACNLTSFSPCLTGPVDYLFAYCHKAPRFKSPRGVLVWNRESPVSYVSLHWWPRRDWSLWPHLRRASSRTVTRPSWRQCDYPTWSHTAFLSRFHACCRSPFRLHNRRSRLLGGSPVESLQSHFILTMSHWSSGLPVCFPSQGTQVQIYRGLLMWNRDSPVSDVWLHIYSTYTHIHINVHMNIHICSMDMACNMDMVLQHGHGHGHAIWTCNVDMTWTWIWSYTCSRKCHAAWTSSMDMDMDMQHGHGHAAWTRTCTMDMGLHHGTVERDTI